MKTRHQEEKEFQTAEYRLEKAILNYIKHRLIMETAGQLNAKQFSESPKGEQIVYNITKALAHKTLETYFEKRFNHV